ncbi:hypothetical protein R3P38DRAFT_3232793 [Favolaschia claudopus]|uniref:F-box domain-containing protein n=1 Tax=Favolaschia claudopus TaxID=2862362 RepID=A0AAV9ZI23_9AGAR
MSSCANCYDCASNHPHRRLGGTLGDDASPQELRAALADVKSQISRYKDLLAALEEDEENLETRLSDVVYPVSKLPFEVTSSIFIECLPDDEHVTPTASTAPLLLTHVCRQWRDIALSTGALWCSLRIDPNTVTPNLLETWFSRAKERPLSLTLNGAYWSELDYVSANRARFKCLNLQLAHTFGGLHYSENDTLSMVRHLASYRANEDEIWECLENGPPLREFRLLSEDFVYVSLDYHSAKSTLTHLEISARISVAMFFNILRGFPALSHIQCSPLVPPSMFTVNESDDIAQTFPNLLSVSLPSAGDTAALRLLTLPNLTSLKLGPYCIPLDLVNFLIRSACHITHLWLSLAGCDEREDRGQTARLLSCFPFVRSVEITGVEDPTIFMSCLLPPHNHLRGLTELVLNYEVDANDSNGENYGDNWIALLNRMSQEGSLTLTKAHSNFITVYGDTKSLWYPGALAQAVAMRLIEEEGLDLVLSSRCGNDVEIWPEEDEQSDSDSESSGSGSEQL